MVISGSRGLRRAFARWRRATVAAASHRLKRQQPFRVRIVERERILQSQDAKPGRPGIPKNVFRIDFMIAGLVGSRSSPPRVTHRFDDDQPAFGFESTSKGRQHGLSAGPSRGRR